MPSIINATTTNGVAVSGDTSGALALQTNNGTTALTIDTSQNVGIGTTTPTNLGGNFKTLQLQAGSASAGGGYYLTGNGTATAQMGVDTLTGYIGMRSNHDCAFTTNNTERMRITSGGSLLIDSNIGVDFRLRVAGSNSASFGDDYDATVYGAVQIVRPANQGTAFHLAFVRGGQKVAGMGFLNNSNNFAIQNDSNNSGAGVTLAGSATSWGTTSDERKKDIIAPVENALTKLADWRSVYFKYKTDEADAPQRVGLIAQDVQVTLPEAVSVDEDEIKTLQLRYTETIPLLVKAIQELKAELDATKAEVQALKGAQ